MLLERQPREQEDQQIKKSKQGKHNNRRGKCAERELAGLLGDLLGETVTRNLVQSRDGGADLVGTPYALEVKRPAYRPRLSEWWVQACSQAKAASRIPCLAWRFDRQPWQFMLPLGAVHPGFDPLDYSLVVTVGIAEFAAIARESISLSGKSGAHASVGVSGGDEQEAA